MAARRAIAVNRGVLCALASAALFGASTPFAKVLVGAMPPFLLAGLLYAGSGAGLMLLLALRRMSASRRNAIARQRAGEWRWLALAIAFGGIAGPVAMMYGLAMISASTASLLLNLEAVFTALLAWVVFGENYERRVVAGMLAIVAGGCVLAWGPAQDASRVAGTVLIAAACLCWAIDNNLTRKIAASDAVVIAGVKGVAAGAVNLAIALVAGVAVVPAPAMIASALVVGFLGYGMSLVLFVLALRALGSARTGAYFSVAPFFGAIVAVVVRDEAVSWQLGLAGALMAVGVWLHLSERHAHLHAHEALEHRHAHVHDEHHQHAHDAWDEREPHTHHHVHAPLVHAHTHYPDLHHRHPH